MKENCKIEKLKALIGVSLIPINIIIMDIFKMSLDTTKIIIGVMFFISIIFTIILVKPYIYNCLSDKSL